MRKALRGLEGIAGPGVAPRAFRDPFDLGLPVEVGLDFGRGHFTRDGRGLLPLSDVIHSGAAGSRSYVTRGGELRVAAAGEARAADYFSGRRAGLFWGRETNFLAHSEDVTGEGWSRAMFPVAPAVLPCGVEGVAVDRAVFGGVSVYRQGANSGWIVSPTPSPAPFEGRCQVSFVNDGGAAVIRVCPARDLVAAGYVYATFEAEADTEYTFSWFEAPGAIGGFMVSKGAVPPPYIPTFGIVATASPDLVDVALDPARLSDGMTVAARFSFFGGEGSYPRVFELNNGDNANRHALFHSVNTRLFALSSFSAGANQGYFQAPREFAFGEVVDAVFTIAPGRWRGAFGGAVSAPNVGSVLVPPDRFSVAHSLGASQGGLCLHAACIYGASLSDDYFEGVSQ